MLNFAACFPLSFKARLSGCPAGETEMLRTLGEPLSATLGAGEWTPG